MDVYPQFIANCLTSPCQYITICYLFFSSMLIVLMCNTADLGTEQKLLLVIT